MLILSDLQATIKLEHNVKNTHIYKHKHTCAHHGALSLFPPPLPISFSLFFCLTLSPPLSLSLTLSLSLSLSHWTRIMQVAEGYERFWSKDSLVSF